MKYKLQYDDSEMKQRLKLLPDAVSAKILADSIFQATTPAVKAAKANLVSMNAVKTGALKSGLLKVKVVYPKQGVVCVIVGINKQAIVDDKGKIHRPGKYAHLVEKSHKLRNGQKSKAKPFMETALNQTKGGILTRINNIVMKKIDKEMAKRLS